MVSSFKDTFKSVYDLWKKSYVELLPFTVLTVLCFSGFLLSNRFWLVIILSFPGLYLSNILLLKLSAIYHGKTAQPKEIYDLALARYTKTLLLFLGLVGIFLGLTILSFFIAGLFGGLACVAILLVIYSYLIFSYPLVLIENKSPSVALKESFTLINDHLWYITGVFILAGLAEGIAHLILMTVVGITVSSLIFHLAFLPFNLALIVVVLELLKSHTTD